MVIFLFRLYCIWLTGIFLFKRVPAFFKFRFGQALYYMPANSMRDLLPFCHFCLTLDHMSLHSTITSLWLWCQSVCYRQNLFWSWPSALPRAEGVLASCLRSDGWCRQLVLCCCQFLPLLPFVWHHLHVFNQVLFFLAFCRLNVIFGKFDEVQRSGNMISSSGSGECSSCVHCSCSMKVFLEASIKTNHCCAGWYMLLCTTLFSFGFSSH